MGGMKLDLVQIVAVDWDALTNWYINVLGLEAVAKEDDHRYAQLRFPAGGALLGIVGGRDVEKGKSRCIPFIRVEDLPGTVTTLKERGVQFLGDLRGGDEGFRIISAQDPEGNRLDFYEYL